MDEVVFKKICQFLRNQTDMEAVFSTFWDKTKQFYPPGQSKTKLKAWLKAKIKENPESLEVIKSEAGDPFGKLKLKEDAPSNDLPDTTWAEDVELTQKLIVFVDNQAKNGHLYANICNSKASIFPEKLQDKKNIKLWLTEHANLFKLVNDCNGGAFSVAVLQEARNVSNLGPLIAPVSVPAPKNAKRSSKATPRKAKDDTGSVDLLKLADEIVLRVSEKISKQGETIPLESLFAAKDVITPLTTEEALMNFLAAFPSKFEVIELGGLGKWVHLKGSDNAIANVTSFIFQNGGTVPFGNLVKQSANLLGETVNSPAALSTWLNSNADVFEVITKPDDPKPWQVKVHIPSPPRFCHNYVTQGQCPRKKCQFLHICKAFVCQRPHDNAECKLSHDIRDEHNKVIIDKMGALSKETDAVVVNVLLKSFFPRVCSDYNKNVLCPRGDNCHFLHICGNYVLNQCGNPVCPLSHNLDHLHNINILKKYAMLPSQKLSHDIVKANIAYAQVTKLHPGQSAGLGITRPLSDHVTMVAKTSGHTVEKKKRQRHRPRHRGRKSSQASSTVDGSDSEETDSSTDHWESASNASSSRPNAARPSLSLHNLQKSELAVPLSGFQKVDSWMHPGEIGSENSIKEQDVRRERSDSTSSSEVSVVSAQSSLISSQSVTWQDDEQKKIFVSILENYKGDAPFSKISKELFKGVAVDTVKWFQNHPQKFILHRNGQGKVDSVSAFSPRARLCLDYNGKRGCGKPKCGFLHICRYHIEGHCPKGKTCNLNHNLGCDEVTQVVKRMGLQDLTHRQLSSLIQVSVPVVCDFHNQGGCNRNENCPKLHVCKAFAQGRRFCRAKPCRFGHEQALRQGHATKILKMYKLYGKQPNYKYIKKMIFVFDKRRQSNEHGERRDAAERRDVAERHVMMQCEEPKSPRKLMDIDLTQVVDPPAEKAKEIAPNICPQFLLGQCRVKKCEGLHFALPYCWQFKLSNASWCNFKKIDCVNVEKYFCDVNCIDAGLNISTNISGCASSIRLDFQSMSGHPQPSSGGESFQIRRLECRRMTAQKLGEAWFETQWTWYELASSSRWVEYDASKASVLEELFLKGNISIDWSTHRRRPRVFLTESEVNEKKRSGGQEKETAQPSSSEPSISRAAEEEVVQPSNCLRTRVEPDSPEYKDIKKLLGNTPLVINDIEKIVSDDLWDKYKNKKKSMTDKLTAGESLKDGKLFIPCLRDDVERIVKENISASRIILDDHPFGPGHYFTSNASSCIQWCREHYPHSRLSLIVCQVLLGTYTQGSAGLKEFPLRSNGRFYDSLVDNKDDPSVFVIENVEQCYPAFVIDFSEVTTPVADATTLLRDFTIVENSRVTPQEMLPSPPPAYQDVPAHQHLSHPLLPDYVPESSNRSPVVLQQQAAPSNTPPTPLDYVKVAPPYSETAAPTSDAPPEYTPYPQPPHTQTSDVPRRSRGNPAQNLSGLSKDKKDCLVM